MKKLMVLWLFLSAISAAAQIPPPIDLPSRHATVFGAKMHYYDAGTGPVVVLLHGLADEAGVWQPVIDPLVKAGYRVIVPDQIGHGRSDKPTFGYRLSTFTDFVEQLLTELKVEKAILVGNSLGGWVSTDMAIRYPEKVAAIVNVCGPGYADLLKLSPVALDNLRLSSREQARALIPYLFHDAEKWGAPEVVDGLITQRVINGDGHTIDSFLQSMSRGEDMLDGKLGKVKAPTLVLWGGSDRLVPVSIAERFHRDIAGSQLHVIPRCGHMPQVECPAEFTPVLLKFLDGVRAQR
jgi:pimeloyl-ACP methyl ester carboxylesterase